MKLIDTHAHLTHPDLSGNISEILDLAKKAGVEKIITCGTNLQDSRVCCELALEHEMIYAAVGVHPTEIENPETDFRFELTELAKNPKVVAIGEIGLDYYWEKDKAKREIQKKILRAQLGAAVQLDLPVIIHNREADSDIYDELEHYLDSERLRGVMHCFLGGESDFQRLKKLNFLVSFTGVITYPSFPTETLALLKSINHSSCMIETDSPFLSPEPRVKPNTPAQVLKVAEKLAEIWGITVGEVSEITTANAKKLFKI